MYVITNYITTLCVNFFGLASLAALDFEVGGTETRQQPRDARPRGVPLCFCHHKTEKVVEPHFFLRATEKF